MVTTTLNIVPPLMALACFCVLAILASSCSAEDRFQVFVDEALEELVQKQEDLKTNWRLGNHDHFDWSQDTGLIVFSSGGVPHAVADIQFVGSVSKTSRTWLWAWANPSIDPALTVDVQKVAEIGRERGFEKLTERKWPADEADGWAMSAVAAKVTGAAGAYRTEDRIGYSYLLLKNLRPAPVDLEVDHSGDPPE